MPLDAAWCVVILLSPPSREPSPRRAAAPSLGRGRSPAATPATSPPGHPGGRGEIRFIKYNILIVFFSSLYYTCSDGWRLKGPEWVTRG